MPSGNNILAVIAVLVVSVRGSPPKIDRGSYTYDPGSIVQNEKILRLFLQLASETANHLIRLKNETKHPEESLSRVDTKEPAVPVKLSDDNDQRRITNGNRYGQRKQSVNPYERKADGGQRVKEPEESDGTSPRESNVKQSSRKINDDLWTRAGRKIDREEFAGQPYISDNTTDSKNVSAQDRNLKKPTNGSMNHVTSITSPGELSKGTGRNTTTKDSTEQPVDIESRMMFNIQKNNYVSHEQTKTISNADTKITSIDLPLPENISAMRNISGLFDPLIVSRKPESNGESKSSVTIGKGQTLPSSNQIKTAATAITQQALGSVSNPESGSKATTSQPQKLPSSGQNGGALIDRQILQPETKFQSESKGIIAKAQELRSRGISGNETEGVVTGAGSSGQNLASSGQSGSEAAGIKHFSPISNLQSQSKGIVKAVDELASTGRSKNVTAGMMPLDSSPLTNLQPESKGIVRAVEELASSGQSGRRAVGMVFSPDSSPGKNVESESKGMVKSLEKLASKGQSGNGAGEIVDQVIRSNPHRESNELSALSMIQDASSKILNKSVPTENGNQAGPASSVGQSSTGQIGKILVGIADTGAKYAGSLVTERVNGPISKQGTSNERGNPTSSLIESTSGGMSGIGSRLMGSLPLFRAFPHVNDQSRRNDNVSIDITKLNEKHRSNNESRVTLDQPDAVKDHNLTGNHDKPSENLIPKKSEKTSLIDDHKIQGVDTVNQLPEFNLHDFADKFAEALRPVYSGQNVAG